MDEEVPPASEFDNQILAAPTDCSDLLALEGGGHRFGGLGPREPWICYLDALEATADEPGLEVCPDSFDFR
jgi:hypothetical protein